MSFNLELFKQGRDAVTRNGKVARFIAHVPNLKTFQLVAVVDDTFHLYTDVNGKFFINENDGLDLVDILDSSNVVFKVVVMRASGIVTSQVFKHFVDAKEYADKCDELSFVKHTYIFNYTQENDNE